jgi:CHAD domain-containing protein
VAVHPYLRDCADELVDAGGRGDVHDLRVACRRIRSVLRSCRSLWPETDERLTPLVERCRQLGSHLSDARDDEVAADVLGELADEGGWADGDLEQLLSDVGLPHHAPTAVDGGHTVAPEHLAEALTLAGDVRAFASMDLVAADLAADVAADELSGGLEELGRTVESERRRVLQRAGRADTTEAWHDVRKAAKRLRYTAEAHLRAARDDGDADGASAAATSAKATVTAAKRLQTVLGDLRDAEQLIDRLVACAAGPLADRALAAAVRRVRELQHQVPPTVDQLHRPSG